MMQYTEEGFEGFTFEITMEDNVYSLIKEGYLTLDEYLDSLRYVLKESAPDCIYKKGYDLFGPDQIFYYYGNPWRRKRRNAGPCKESRLA